jgi:hypothetical protein
VARERPTASDVQQVLSDVHVGNPVQLVSAGATPGPDSTLSPAQMRALRRSDRLTSDECTAHRRRTEPQPPLPIAGPPPV